MLLAELAKYLLCLWLGGWKVGGDGTAFSEFLQPRRRTGMTSTVCSGFKFEPGSLLVPTVAHLVCTPQGVHLESFLGGCQMKYRCPVKFEFQINSE